MWPRHHICVRGHGFCSYGPGFAGIRCLHRDILRRSKRTPSGRFQLYGNRNEVCVLDRFTGMAVFVKVVEASSFAAAARHFGMSPAMVSKHIHTTEERLGI